MQDKFGRQVTYLRLSVTDRCDLRCLYCMAEDVEFLPKADLLSLEELQRLCGAFIRLGIRRIRLTGGEPLVRRGVMSLIDALGEHIRAGALDELTLTTNGTQLAGMAAGLAAAGVRRINVSLDSLDSDVFRQLTRRGDIGQVLEGLAAAKAVGLKVRINAVALKGINDDGFDQLIAWCGTEGFDLCLIETMPFGDVDHHAGAHLPLSAVRAGIEARWTLVDTDWRSGGPARYVQVAETGGRLGFITPLSNNFCEGCNRVRVTCTGGLYTCLGHDQTVDLRGPLRVSDSDEPVTDAILAAIAAKPKAHDFIMEPGAEQQFTRRCMSLTGG